jgi:2-polyprenyl-6-methoxyphenol hydroxylase-like FAD-dependent oxidoreductase
LRVSAITPASSALLEQCGAWPLLDHRRVRAFTKMQVWDSEGGGCMQFDSGAPGEGENGASLGSIVENRNIQSSLAKRLAAVGNSVQVFDSVAVSRVASGSDASVGADSVDRPALDNFALVELRHQDGSTRQLRTRLLVRLPLGFILHRDGAG